MRNPKVLGSLALVLVLVVLAGYKIRHTFKSDLSTHQVYFYNIETKTLFTATDQLLPPIDTSSGAGTGVRAYVFRCADGSGASNFIAYLEEMTPDGKTAAGQELKDDHSPAALGFFMDKHPDAFLVRNLQDETWYPKSEAAGRAAMNAGINSGGCDHPVPCLPQ
jgi:hypothetical protein